jgi:hypothetical protein
MRGRSTIYVNVPYHMYAPMKLFPPPFLGLEITTTYRWLIVPYSWINLSLLWFHALFIGQSVIAGAGSTNPREKKRNDNSN